MVDPTDKDTKHIKDQSTGTEGDLEYTKEKEKGKVNQLDVGNKKDQQNSGSSNPRTSKTARTKLNDQHWEQMIKITEQENSNNKTKWPTSRVDNRLLFLKENNNKISKIQSHKMQTAVANVRVKNKYVFTQKEQICYAKCSACTISTFCKSEEWVGCKKDTWH